MTENSSKLTAFWADELPQEIRAMISEASIDALIKNFIKTNDPYCIALLCDQINAADHEKRALDIIRQFAMQKAHKKGLRYLYKTDQVLILWKMLRGRDTDTNVRRVIAKECGLNEEAVRKIIEKS